MGQLFGRRSPGAQVGCDCRVCRPDEPAALDDQERKAIADVRQYGVHVILVSDSQDCDCGHPHGPVDASAEPDFAYTVGLWHQRRHPELLISGLSRMDVMHRVLNDLALGVIRDGSPLVPGRAYEDVLSAVPVTLEELTPEARAATATWSAWFHRRDVPVLQVVWPDMDGRFAWQGGAGVLDERQPPAWRVPGPRTGALAPDPPWPFAVAQDTLVVACTHVASGESPVLYVQHDSDPNRGEDWSVSCGQPHDASEVVTWHLAHALTRCPGLRDVAGLPLDHWAERPSARSPWTIGRSQDAAGPS